MMMGLWQNVCVCVGGGMNENVKRGGGQKDAQYEDEKGNEDEDKEEQADEEEYEPIHQSLSARLRSTASTGGSKSVTRKLENDQNFTHFCRYVWF